MVFEEDLSDLNLCNLKISDRNSCRRRGHSTDRGVHKMDICLPQNENAAPTNNAHSAVNIQQLEISAPLMRRGRSEPSAFPSVRQSSFDVQPRRDNMQLARKLYVLPYFLSGYVQLFLNVTIVSFSVYLLWCFYSTVRDDIDTKIQLFSEEVVQKMTKCSIDYRENKCDPSLRVPAMASLCRTWEQCMQQDPMTVATRAKFSAETFGEGLNAFFEKISWKTIICMCCLLFGFLISYNVAFYFAARQNPHRGFPSPPMGAHWDPRAAAYYPPPLQAPAPPPLADINYAGVQQNRHFW